MTAKQTRQKVLTYTDTYKLICIFALHEITVLEYEKTPHFILEEKINLCLKTYRVTPELMEKGNLKEGENIVFLRFVERELKPE